MVTGTLSRYFGLRFLIQAVLVFLGILALVALVDYIEMMRKTAGMPFIPASVVQVNGSNRATTFVSSTRLTAAMPAGDVTTASFPSISVQNPGPGGGVYALTFAVNNPQPTLTSLSPSGVTAGSGSFTLTLNGTNFIPTSVVQVNGSNRTTTFVSGTRLTATIPASDVASASALSVSVVNPGPGGGVWAINLPVNGR